ncbi:hypothetical protein [Crossiella sp. CA198]|uniref:hypothetical protein n=1 Tax=Crossiella sp. CA198 TaxID=3455607 RepID=UPI003F8CFD79
MIPGIPWWATTLVWSLLILLPLYDLLRPHHRDPRPDRTPHRASSAARPVRRDTVAATPNSPTVAATAHQQRVPVDSTPDGDTLSPALRRATGSASARSGRPIGTVGAAGNELTAAPTPEPRADFLASIGVLIPAPADLRHRPPVAVRPPVHTSPATARAERAAPPESRATTAGAVQHADAAVAPALAVETLAVPR